MMCGLAWNLNSIVAFRDAARHGLARRSCHSTEHPARHQPEGGPRLRPWRSGAPASWLARSPVRCSSGWLTDAFSLALDLLRQPAGRHPRLFGRGRLPAAHSQAAARFRLLRLRHAVDRRRLASADARPRRAGRLVRVRRDLDRARPDHRRLWVFTIHLLTSKSTFIDPRSSSTWNFVTGLVFIFVIGIVLFSSLALLPPMLSNLFNLSTVTTRSRHGAARRRHDDLDDPGGAPRAPGRCVGSWSSPGCCSPTASLYEMTGFSPQMDDYLIITSGVVQGLGLGWSSCR